MTTSDKIRTYLQANGPGNGCKESFEQYVAANGTEGITYANFNRVYRLALGNAYVPRIVTRNKKGKVIAVTNGEPVIIAKIEDEEYRTRTKYSKNEIPYDVWFECPPEHVPSEKVIGCAIWVAGTPRTWKHILMRFHEKGTPGWTRHAGCTVKEPGVGNKTKYLHIDSCRIHPDVYKIKRKKEPEQRSMATI